MPRFEIPIPKAIQETLDHMAATNYCLSPDDHNLDQTQTFLQADNNGRVSYTVNHPDHYGQNALIVLCGNSLVDFAEGIRNFAIHTYSSDKPITKLKGQPVKLSDIVEITTSGEEGFDLHMAPDVDDQGNIGLKVALRKH